MITKLRRIKGHSKLESIEFMLEVIEVLEKNFAQDNEINNEDWLVLITWLEKYYCELKEMWLIRRGLEQK